MILMHKIALDPTQEQVIYFAKACGVARFSYNWALAEWQRQYAEWREYRCGPKPSWLSLSRELNAIKATAFPWMMEVAKSAPQQAIKNLGGAFKNFFEGRKKYPRFKKKGAARDRFRAGDGPCKAFPTALETNGKRIKLPVIGWVRMRETVRFVGKIKFATVSRVADRWFVSLCVEVDRTPPVRENQAVVGVDLGVKALATLSDGSVIEGPNALRTKLKTLRRRDRNLTRKVKGSANRRKAARKLARLHARIVNIRKDALHKATTAIVRKFSVIGIEDLNVRGLMANRSLARSIGDVGMGEFRRQLTYKAAMQGARIVVADRWFPSSKTCSDCGTIFAGLTLLDREWTCDGCGVIHDRDHNAAINLMNMAGSSSVTACGAISADLGLAAKVKLTAVKQELGAFV